MRPLLRSLLSELNMRAARAGSTANREHRVNLVLLKSTSALLKSSSEKDTACRFQKTISVLGAENWAIERSLLAKLLANRALQGRAAGQKSFSASDERRDQGRGTRARAVRDTPGWRRSVRARSNAAANM